jgi:hypothetical protein
VTIPTLKEWAVTIEALLAGEQVIVLRKGGIGEKRFEIPHDRFFLFPSHVHQRAELVTPDARNRYADLLGVDEEPDVVEVRAWAEVTDAHRIEDPAAISALSGHHVLTDAYATERLRWRRTQPLWGVVLRIYELERPLRVEVLPEHGGCVSWIDLDADPSAARRPALEEEEFTRAARSIADTLAGLTVSA